jgi:peptidyl-prolyl cis-trans isomerase D
MIGSFRNFAKTKFAGLLVFIMIIPFVFWGMGSMFNSGNTNTIAKINKTNISTQEFIDYLNNSNISQEAIRENLKNNIIEELLSGLISRTLIELEVIDYNVIVSEKTLLKKIKENKNFKDESGNFQRLKYEKFLLENNQSAPAFELRLKERELQKSLFDYMGAGTVSPQFLINRLYEEENKKLEVDFINLENFYKKKNEFTNKDLKQFINENKDQLKIEYIDFDYAIINPENLIGINDYNQSFFDKIDQIEVDISNEVQFGNIVSNLNIAPINIINFKFSSDKNKIEQKIFELRNNNFDIFETDNDYILYKINSIEKRKPDLTDAQTKEEIIELISQKNKFDFNRKLLEKIGNKKFNDNDFLEMGQNKIETMELNSNRDNKKFEINAVKTLYSLPVNSFTLINDKKNNIYLAKIKRVQNVSINKGNNELKEYKDKQNSNMKNDMLKTYDLFLNKKYDVVINQKTLERVKNFFQ